MVVNAKILLIIFLLTTLRVSASEITFSKQYLTEGVVALIELSDGGYIGSAWDRNYPVLIRFDNRGNAIYAWEYVIQRRGHIYFDHLIKTDDGGVAAIGARVTGSAPFAHDPIIAKFDASGLPQWQIMIPGKSFDTLNWIHQNRDGGYIVVGYSDSDAWIVKLRSSGHVSWSKTIQQGKFSFVKEDPDGGFLVAGTSQGQIIIVKLDSHGKLIWHHIYVATEPNNLEVTAAVATSANSIVLAGSYTGSSASTFLIRIGSKGGIIWTKVFSSKPHSLFLSSVIKSKNGDFVAAGSADEIRGFENRGLLLKVSSQGKLSWARIADSELLSPDENVNGGFSLTGMGAGFYGILKTNANGFIPNCSLLQKLSVKVQSPKIRVLKNEILQVKPLSIQTESLSITPRRISVVGQEACN